MKTLVEFLSTTIKNKTDIKDIYDYMTVVLERMFGNTENQDILNEIRSTVMSYMKRKKFDNYRVFGNSKTSNDILKDIGEILDIDTISLFYNLMNDKEWLFENVAESIEEIAKDYDDIAGETNDFRIWLGDWFVYIQGDDNGFVIENLEKNADPNPKYDTYYSRTRYVELSNRKIIIELDNVPDNDQFWSNYNEMCDDYVKQFEEQFEGIELHVFGSGGRHVCALPTLLLFHQYDEIIKSIKTAQDNLVKDAQDEADYITSKMESENS